MSERVFVDFVSWLLEVVISYYSIKSRYGISPQSPVCLSFSVCQNTGLFNFHMITSSRDKWSSPYVPLLVTISKLCATDSLTQCHRSPCLCHWRLPDAAMLEMAHATLLTRCGRMRRSKINPTNRTRCRVLAKTTARASSSIRVLCSGQVSSIM